MGAKSIDDISYSQRHKFLLALKKAGLTSAVAQEVINSWGNRKAKAMMAALNGEEVRDNLFKLVRSFDVVVPENYHHTIRLDWFRREHRHEFYYYYNDDITDQNFGKATTKLVSGRKMTVKVFQITCQVTSEDCLYFLKGQKAILVGAQGASLAYEQLKNQLPKDRWYVSFDKKKALWKNASCHHMVPHMDVNSDGDFELYDKPPALAGVCV